MIVATAAINVPGYARLMRNPMLSVKESQLALAAVAVGNPRSRLLWRHDLAQIHHGHAVGQVADDREVV